MFNSGRFFREDLGAMLNWLPADLGYANIKLILTVMINVEMIVMKSPLIDLIQAALVPYTLIFMFIATVANFMSLVFRMRKTIIGGFQHLVADLTGVKLLNWACHDVAQVVQQSYVCVEKAWSARCHTDGSEDRGTRFL